MNQLSGKITTLFFRGYDTNFYVHERGHQTPNRVGGLCMSFSGSKWNNPSLMRAYIASFPVQLVIEHPMFEKTITVTRRTDFYSEFKTKLRRRNSNINEGHKYHLEFFYQKPLPCFDEIIVTKITSNTSQQSLEDYR